MHNYVSDKNINMEILKNNMEIQDYHAFRSPLLE